MLVRTESGLRFANEAALEDFVWANLQELFGLEPLARQLRLGLEICDILGVSPSGKLTVLELKNVEDSGLVQQLTRYHAALTESRPFAERIDYGLGVELVAVAPQFHRNNLIDRRYSTLSFKFWRHRLTEGPQGCFFLLEEPESELAMRLGLPTVPAEQPTDLLPMSRQWKALLTNCHRGEEVWLAEVRETLLRFDRRMEETPCQGGVAFGRAPRSPCAEVRFDRAQQTAVLLLWLPYVHVVVVGDKRVGRVRLPARMRIWTEGQAIFAVAHAPRGTGNGRPGNRPEGPIWTAAWCGKREENYLNNLLWVPRLNSKGEVKALSGGRNGDFDRKPAPLGYYLSLVDDTPCPPTLSGLLDVVAKRWLAKLDKGARGKCSGTEED